MPDSKEQHPDPRDPERDPDVSGDGAKERRREESRHVDEPRASDESQPREGTPAGDHGEAPREPAIRYERKDISLRWILMLVAGATCLIVVQLTVTWWLLEADRQRHRELMKSSYPVAPAPSTTLPPEPRLEPLDRYAGVESSNVFLRQLAYERTLHSYGTTGEEGFVHIPIEDAMKLAAGKLPVRAETPAPEQPGNEKNAAGPSTRPPPKDNGLLGWGDANSGRVYREKRERIK